MYQCQPDPKFCFEQRKGFETRNQVSMDCEVKFPTLSRKDSGSEDLPLDWDGPRMVEEVNSRGRSGRI